ncbi:MAG: hypothetical protein LUH15_19185 [Tannerellaceae bacterium]|nr:hypothetical protein [Tannerellaceae bacterium]
MKKIILLSIMIAGIFLTSCEKDKIGGTATESLAGEWYVTVDAMNADGSTWGEDPFGIGHFLIATYNTAANIESEIWVDDSKQFWGFKVKAKADANTLTFSVTNAENGYEKEHEDDEDCIVSIMDGKILLRAATTPSGMPADSIVFKVTFSDDTNTTNYGFDHYKISGYRYTGLANDD